MHRSWLKTATAALLVATFGAGCAAHADSPFVGNWKLLDVDSGNESALVLFEITEKDGKPQAKVLAAPLLGKGVSIEHLQVDAASMQFDVKFGGGTLGVKAYRDDKTKAVRGVIHFNNRLLLAQFNKTDDTDLKQEDAESATAEGEQLEKAKTTEDAKEKQAALKELVDKRADKPAAYSAARLLLESYVKEGAKDDEVSATADKFVKIGARFGPEVEKNTVALACQTLTQGEKVSPAALEFVRKSEKALTKDDPPASASKILRALALALKKTGKEKDAKELEPRIDKLEEEVDAVYEKTAVPFKVEAYKERKGEGKRVAVVELFTGAYCPPCVGADVAFDAALQTYKPTDVILLQYHVHIPAPDRLANADTDSRTKYYGDNIAGVPTAFLNGKVTKPLGGSKGSAKESYDTLREAVDDALKAEDAPPLKFFKIERNGDKIDIVGEFRKLEKTGKNVKLRFLLVEDVARYPGGNGQRLHRHVVRALPGGADGFSLTEVEGRKSVSVNLADLKKSLDEYMTKYNEGPRKFLDDEYPLDLKRLKVVALIQDDDNKQILQAVQADVPDAK